MSKNISPSNTLMFHVMGVVLILSEAFAINVVSVKTLTIAVCAKKGLDMSTRSSKLGNQMKCLK